MAAPVRHVPDRTAQVKTAQSSNRALPAGGRSSNARPDGIGHTRGNLLGTHAKPLLGKTAGHRTVEGAFTLFLERGPAALTLPLQAPTGARTREDADFLERVSLAEKRDDEGASLLHQLQQIEAQPGFIEAAAAQLAAEEHLDAEQQSALAHKMLAHVSEQAHKLRTLMASPRRDGLEARLPRQHSSTPTGTLTGILSPERPRAGGASPDETRNPIKGHGVCNPLVEYTPKSRTATGGVQYMPNMGGAHSPSNYQGAAGVSSSEAWRTSTDYMAHGAEGYGDFRSEHLALQSNRKAQAARARGDARVTR